MDPPRSEPPHAPTRRGSAASGAASAAAAADPRSGGPSSSSDATGASDAASGTAEEGAFVRLPVPGHRPAVVSLPIENAAPRPLLVATHGAGGRPEPHCQLWRRIVEAQAFVLCPAGAATHPHAEESETGYYYPGHPALAEELGAAIDALRARYGSRLDAREPVYAGYSQGATMGALVLPTHSASFARAVLVEGGSGEAREWDIAAARRFAEHGGRRVLLACGRPACAEAGAVTVRSLRQGGLEARLVHVAGAGHSYGGPMEQALGPAFAWLVEGDSRWQAGLRAVP